VAQWRSGAVAKCPRGAMAARQRASPQQRSLGRMLYCSLALKSEQSLLYKEPPAGGANPNVKNCGLYARGN